jgi:ArsR family transcriptional regulator
MTLREWEKKRRLGHRIAILKAVAHPVRLCIIDALAATPTHVNALAEALDVPQAIVSQQLRILRMSKVVEVERKNGLAVYHLAEEHLRELLKCMDRCCST